MESSWIPTWVATVWTVAFVLTLGVHLRHTLTMDGRSRWWHATHVLMALGMIDMFWPVHPMPADARTGEIVFAVAGIGVAGVVVDASLRHVRDGFLWEITVVDLIAMFYMYLEPDHDFVLLTLALIAWFSFEALGWASGLLALAAQAAGLGAVPAGPPTRRPRAAVGAGRGPRSPAAAQVEAIRPLRRSDDPLHSRAVRLTLAVMSGGMAYMLLALYFGMGAHMPGMTGM